MSKKYRRAFEKPTVDVQVMVGETVSIASILIHGPELHGMGETKRLPGDVWSAEVGAEIAFGRALVDAGRQLLEKHKVELRDRY